MFVNKPTITNITPTTITDNVSIDLTLPQDVVDLVNNNQFTTVAEIRIELYNENNNIYWQNIATKKLLYSTHGMIDSNENISVNLSYATPTSNGKIRAQIVVYPSGINYYSDYDEYSETIIVVGGNIPSPYYILPNGGVFDINKIIRLNWVAPAGYENIEQSKYEIEWYYYTGYQFNSGGPQTPTINTIIGIGNAREHFIQENYFSELKQVVWRVRQYGLNNQPSAWSSWSKFNLVSSLNTPSIIQPTNTSTVNNAHPNFIWLAVDQQNFSFRLELNGVEVFVDPHNYPSNQNEYTLNDYDLESGKSYIAYIAIQDINGTWSDEASVAFVCSFDTVETPTINSQLVLPDINEYDNYNGGPLVNINITNPEGGVDVLRNDLWRIDYYIDDIEKNFAITDITYSTYYDIAKLKGYKKLIKRDIGTEWIDYTIGSGYYIYFVRTWGVNGTYKDSFYDVDNLIVCKFNGFVLMPSTSKELGSNTALNVGNLSWRNKALYVDYFAESHSETFSYDVNYLQFNGRKSPCAEIGISETHGIDISFDLITSSDIIAFNRMVSSREPVLYRDESGNKFYALINTKKTSPTDFTDVIKVDLSLTKIDMVDYFEKSSDPVNLDVWSLKGRRPSNEFLFPIIYIDKEDVE